jgi:hypothetical protein
VDLGPPDQSLDGIRPNLSGEVRVRGNLHVRRIADDQGDGAAPGGGHRAEEVSPPDRHVESQADGVVPGQVDRLLGPVHGHDLGPG